MIKNDEAYTYTVTDIDYAPENATPASVSIESARIHYKSRLPKVIAAMGDKYIGHPSNQVSRKSQPSLQES